MVGTIYDKYEYLGNDFCNERELELLELMGFAPFRFWSPIHESLDSYYSDTQEGLERMEQLAAEAGDRFYQRLIRLYRYLNGRWMSRCLSSCLLSSKRQKLYELICRKIESASLNYEVRDYGVERNLEIEEARNQVKKDLAGKGYTGSYPYFQRGTVQIYAAEEHPYVLSDMEYSDFKFRIHLMVFQNGKIWIAKSEEIE